MSQHKQNVPRKKLKRSRSDKTTVCSLSSDQIFLKGQHDFLNKSDNSFSEPSLVDLSTSSSSLKVDEFTLLDSSFKDISEAPAYVGGSPGFEKFDIETCSQEELERLIEKYGLKSSDVSTMRKQLKKLTYKPISPDGCNLSGNKYLAHSESECILPENNKGLTLLRKVTTFIKSDKVLHQSVLMYEPLDLVPFLNTLKAEDIECTLPELKECLDSQSIIYGDSLSKRRRKVSKPPLPSIRSSNQPLA